MKTKVRIIKSDRNNGYAHLYLQFLTSRYLGSDYLNVAFTITYQTGDPDSRESNCYKNWYAFKYEIETDRIENIKYALKVANYLEKHIESYEDKDKPEKVLEILGAELYVYDHEYLPVSLNNGAEYKICHKGAWYKSILCK